MPGLLGLIVREAGKSLSNAVAEVREAVDFLRYYGAAAASLGPGDAAPLGPVACISPWNFPLAIFTGQVAAALAAGNPVLAKPAEQTPLIAAQAVAILHEAGVPGDVLQLLPGQSEVGARIVADARVHGVVFTGSNDVATRIQRTLAGRLNPDGNPVPFIAETGGQNALVVDSSALAEQVVADVLVSAFDSAGQRCSALRVLCLQDDIADRTLHDAAWRAAGADGRQPRPPLDRYRPGDLGRGAGRHRAAHPGDAGRGPRRHAHDAAGGLPGRHLRGADDHRAEPPGGAAAGGVRAGAARRPVRPRRAGRTAGGHRGDGLRADLRRAHPDRRDGRARHVPQASAGNIYVNRNLIGAVVGVQPFGGHGLSGTGPKAGGPLYVRRLLARPSSSIGLGPGRSPPAARSWCDWLARTGHDAAAAACAADLARTPVGVEQELRGPVGERNVYTTEPRGPVLCIAAGPQTLFRMIGAALATGNRAVLAAALPERLRDLPAGLVDWVVDRSGLHREDVAAILFDGDDAGLLALAEQTAATNGPVLAIHRLREDGSVPLEWLVRERSVSINTTAAGGNAHLMMIG